MVREMPAYKIEPEIPEEKSFGEKEREELAELRKRQIGELTSGESARIRELTGLEPEPRTGFRPLNAEEHAEYLELSKMDSYAPEQSARFVALQERMDKAGRAEV